MKAGFNYSVVFSAIASLVCASACFSPDPRTADGALEYLALAANEGDKFKLFRGQDQVARHALDATFKMRHETARIISDTYPASAVPAALAELGDALNVESTLELFFRRCDAACLEWFSRNLGAAAEQQATGALVVIRTINDTKLTLRKGTDGWYGVVWRTDEWVAERDRAARDLAQVQENARVYSARKRLEPTRGK